MPDYDRLAGRYDEDRARWSFPPDELIETGDLVLDVGTGTGRWIAAQRDALGGGAAFVGLDPSAGMLAEAAAKGLGALVRSPAEALPFADATFDVVAMSYCFHHFTDKDRALDEARRVLRADGRFRLNNLDEPTKGWWLYRYFPTAIDIDRARFWPTDRLVDALDARGFDVSVEREGGVSETDAAQALADAERRVVSQLVLVSDDAYERGLERLRADVANGPATLPSVRSRLSIAARLG